MDEFVSRLNNLKELQVKKNKTSDKLSFLRLLVFVLGVAITIFLIKKGIFGEWFFVVLIDLSVFIFLVVRHSLVLRELERIKCKIIINQKYLDRKVEKWIDFSDGGEEFINSEHPYTSDLDIYGAKSLFKWMNVSYTYYGRKILKEFLEKPAKDPSTIIMRQSAAKEMGKKFGLSEELQCEGMLSEEIRNNPKELIDYVENRSKLFKSKWALNLFYIMPFITIASTALFLFKYPISPYIPFLMFVIQGSLTAVGYFKAMPVLNKVFKFKSNIEAYQNIIKLIEKEDFETKLLSELKLDFVGLGKAASARLKSLERIVDAIDFRYNIFIYFILNLTLLWDYHCVFALEDWREANRESIKNWIKNIGTLEALSSLSVITQMDTQTCFPTFISKGLKINGIELGHPLILEANRVCNDIEISNNLCIVTGSNMSGKTTLLRTIGINLVLAYAGAPVFAKRFESSIMDIFTSMRIADDLNGGISTFYAELLRIKMIIEYSKKKLPMVFLVDELFRGTNSRDRVIGAKSMLTSLSQPWIIGLISTHDFELCSLDHEKNTNIVNYHFTESYKDNKIHFDYKLLPGRCNTTNAKYLMKMVGIDLIE